jgi:hypothetical protein
LQRLADVAAPAVPDGRADEVVEDPAAAAWFEAGGVAVISRDPDDALEEGVFNIVQFARPSGVTLERNGTRFTEAPAAAITFHDGDHWSTDADIEGGDADGRISVQGMLTHDLGHVLGLGTSCEEGEACDDTAERAAPSCTYATPGAYRVELCVELPESPEPRCADDIVSVRGEFVENPASTGGGEVAETTCGGCASAGSDQASAVPGLIVGAALVRRRRG